MFDTLLGGLFGLGGSAISGMIQGGIAKDSVKEAGKQQRDLARDTFGYQQQLMGLTNQYRTREGATQGQMDEQAFRRLSAGFENQRWMQNRAGQIDEERKQSDARRAQMALRNFRKMGF